LSCRWVDGLIASKLAATGFSGMDTQKQQSPRIYARASFCMGTRSRIKT
jgi:hypothetical protein